MYILFIRTNYHLENFRNLKSRVGFGKWTFLKMSKMENLKSFLKNCFCFVPCH